MPTTPARKPATCAAKATPPLAGAPVLAVTAIVLSVGGSIAGHQGVPSGYILASILKLVAGWFAGFQAGKPAVT